MRARHLLARPELRQQSSRDFFVVWASSPAGVHRRGWVVEPEAPCGTPGCGCHVIDVRVHDVDDRLLAIDKDGDGLGFSWRGASPASATVYEASIDLWSGRVAAPGNHEDGRPVALEATSAAELTAALPGEVLDELWERLERSKGRRVGVMAKKPPRGWEHGDFVEWRKITKHTRPDLYELEVGRVSVETLFCPAPACNCREAMVRLAGYDIRGLDDEEGRGPGGTVRVSFDGSEPRIEAFEGHDEQHLRRAWNAYTVRWPEWRRRLEDQYRRGREALATAIGTPLPDPEPIVLGDDVFTAAGMPLHARGEEVVPPTAGVGRIGRKQPCPCGSGKRYKRCCWPKYDRV